jgi:hypothetical protein
MQLDCYKFKMAHRSHVYTTQATLKDLCADDRAKVGELVKLLATEKTQRRQLELRATKDIKALKREVRTLKKDNSRFVKENDLLVKHLDTSQVGKENSEASYRPNWLDETDEITVSQLKAGKSRNKTVERGCSPTMELGGGKTKPGAISSFNSGREHPADEGSRRRTSRPVSAKRVERVPCDKELQQTTKEASTSPLKDLTSAYMNRSVLIQTVQDAGTQTRTSPGEECRPLVLSDEQRAKQTKERGFRASDDTFGCRTDRKVDSSRTEKSQDTTQDQTCISQDLTQDLNRSSKPAVAEVRSLKQDILSLSMNLRQLKSSRSASSNSRRDSEESAQRQPLDSSRRSPIDLGPLQHEHLKLILDKVHCRGCCLQETIVTSKRNPLSTPSSHSKSPGLYFNTSRARRTPSSLYCTKEFDDMELGNRSITSNYSSRLHRGRPTDLYDDNLYSLVAELEQQPQPSSTQLSVLIEDDELDYSDFSCFNSASKQGELDLRLIKGVV